MQCFKLAGLAVLTIAATVATVSADEWRWHNGRWYVYRTPPGAPGLEAASPFGPAAGTGVLAPQRDGGAGVAPAGGGGPAATAGGLDLQRLESRIATLQLAQAVKRIYDRLGMKSDVNDGTLPLSLMSLSQAGASDGMLLELLAQRFAGANAGPSICASTATQQAAVTPQTISVDPEIQASQTMLELLQAWRTEQASQKTVNEGFQAKVKELEQIQAKMAAERKTKLEDIQKKINELKPKN